MGFACRSNFDAPLKSNALITSTSKSEVRRLPRIVLTFVFFISVSLPGFRSVTLSEPPARVRKDFRHALSRLF